VARADWPRIFIANRTIETDGEIPEALLDTQFTPGTVAATYRVADVAAFECSRPRYFRI
jgi:hypothetical protein